MVPDPLVVVARLADAFDKLIWYRLGGNMSTQQWSEVQGVLRVQGASLDFSYIERFAASLNLSDLLKRARESTQ